MSLVIRYYHGTIRLNDIDEFIKLTIKSDFKKFFQILYWDRSAQEELQNHFETFYYIPVNSRDKVKRNYLYNEVKEMY